MSEDSNKVGPALDRLINHLQVIQPEAPLAIYDQDWPSACYLEKVAEGDPVGWRPVKRSDKEDMFDRLSEALEQPIHPDIVQFFCRYWSDPIPAQCEEGELSLLQIWNSDDMERLRANLIGHALTKKKQRRPLTLFFATTEPDGDYFLSIDNQTGDVWLERPGKAPIRKLADSLAEFLATLTVQPIQNQE